VGGSDQWGNITAGIELIGKRERRQAYGMVFPLVTNASGTKFGKSEAGNVWLDARRTSPYEFYQFWINVDDRDVERYLKLFTFLSLEEIGVALKQHAEDPGKRVAQRLLARDVTLRVHGLNATEEAIRTSEALFGGKTGSETPAEMPTREISRAALGGRLAVVDLLVSSGLASSKADARRGIQGRGFYLNDAPIDAPDLQLSEDQLQGPPDRQFIILRKGKKNYVKLLVLP
jgi:tyrosyl-tRNA synthetase